MKTQDFTYMLATDQSTAEVFNAIKNVRKWWSGFHGETIEGSTDKLNDEFTFTAGKGMHYSKQKLIELIPDKKIVWLVTDSKLSFLEAESEWIGTKIIFEIDKENNKTRIQFTHQGLAPQIECYNECSNAWSQYLQQFAVALNKRN